VKLRFSKMPATRARTSTFARPASADVFERRRQRLRRDRDPVTSGGGMPAPGPPYGRLCWVHRRGLHAASAESQACQETWRAKRDRSLGVENCCGAKGSDLLHCAVVLGGQADSSDPDIEKPSTRPVGSPAWMPLHDLPKKLNPDRTARRFRACVSIGT